MTRALVYVVPLALALYALIDLWRSEPAEHADLTRWGWVAVIVLLPVIGPVAWILISRARRGGPGALRTPRAPSGIPGRAGPTRRPGPIAPDDDPDFLWKLDQQRRHREPPATGGPAAGPGPGAPDGSDSTDGTPGTSLP